MFATEAPVWGELSSHTDAVGSRFILERCSKRTRYVSSGYRSALGQVQALLMCHSDSRYSKFDLLSLS